MMVLMGLLIASFAIWGIGDVFRMSKSGKLATVGSEAISPQAFANEFQRELQDLKRKLGPSFTPSQAISLGLGQRVIQNLTARETFWQAAKRIGLRTPDARVLGEIKKDDAFKNSLGQFDRFTYESLLRSANMTPHMFEETMRQDIARRDLLQSMTSAANAPDILIRLLYTYRKEGRLTRIITVPASKIDTVGEPSEENLQSFHQTNARLFMAPEFRKLSYLMLRPEDKMGDITVSDDELKEQYQKRIDEFSQPERHEVEQIVLPSQVEAKKWYDSIKGGMDFLKAAKESAGFSEADVKLGFLSQREVKDQISPAAANVIFALKPGAVSAPVSSRFGWHIFRILSTKPGSVTPLGEARAKLAAELAREHAVDAIIKVADKIDDSLAAGGGLGEIASNLGLKSLQSATVDRQGNGPDGKPAANLPKISGFLDTAFATEPGSSPILRDAGDGGYYAVVVEQVTPPALKPLAEIRDVVKAQWKTQQQNEAAKAKASEIAAKLKEGVDIASFTAEARGEFHDNVLIPREEVEENKGILPAIQKIIFALEPGKAGVSAAPNGDGYIVMQLKAIVPGDPAKNPVDFEAMKQRVGTEFANDVLVEYQNALNRQYGMEINRDLLNKTTSQMSGETPQ
jgi:peptidyl-prolyl cis-trans isomerase D